MSNRVDAEPRCDFACPHGAWCTLPRHHEQDAHEIAACGCDEPPRHRGEGAHGRLVVRTPTGFNCESVRLERDESKAEHRIAGCHPDCFAQAAPDAERPVAEHWPNIFIVVCEDRHTDPKISVHRTRAGADRHVAAFMAEYRDDGYQWEEEPVDGWLTNIVTDDDGPRVRIEAGELEE
jgi:hypothetical protein